MKAGGRSAADETLAAALAAGRTVADAAELAGVGETTVYRRLLIPQFKDRVRELRALAVASALGRLTDGMTEAADELRALVKDPSADVRFKACVKVLELALRTREQVDLEDRLREVERQLAGDTESPDPEAGV